MTDLVIVLVFVGMIAAGAWIMKAVDSFINRYVVQYSDEDGEEEKHERSETARKE